MAYGWHRVAIQRKLPRALSPGVSRCFALRAEVSVFGSLGFRLNPKP